jgi:hypothetical protein
LDAIGRPFVIEQRGKRKEFEPAFFDLFDAYPSKAMATAATPSDAKSVAI